MDSGNSGSVSSSGDEEYDSHADLPATLLNHPTHFGSISHPDQSSLVSSQHPSLFDLSSSYLHSLSQSQPNSNPHSLQNLDTGCISQGQRSELNCTDPASLPSSSLEINQSFLGPQAHSHDDNARVVPLSAPATNNNNAVRNSKKRTRASRRAPTTVLTTDATNFRSMVQEFTGIPAPPFSASSSYSRRLDLLAAGSSSLRSNVASHSTAAFYPLRPSPQKVQPNPLLLSSSSSPLASRLLHNNMVDAIASTTTNISSSATTTNNSSSSNNSINYQLPPPDLGLPYHHPHNIMLSMQNHPIQAFHLAPPPLHTLANTLPAGFGAKSQASLSINSLEDLGMSHGQVNDAHMVAATGVSVLPSGHEHVASEGMPLRGTSNDGCGDGIGGRRDPFRCLDIGSYGKVASVGGSCKLNFSASASSSLNHDKTLENSSTRGEGNVDSWICSSD